MHFDKCQDMHESCKHNSKWNNLDIIGPKKRKDHRKKLANNLQRFGRKPPPTPRAFIKGPCGTL